MALHLPRQASRHFANFIALRLLQSLSDEFIERKRFRHEKWMETDNGSPIPTHTHISRIDERVVYKAIRERELIWRGVVVNSPKIHLKKKEMRFVCSAFANGKIAFTRFAFNGNQCKCFEFVRLHLIAFKSHAHVNGVYKIAFASAVFHTLSPLIHFHHSIEQFQFI